MIITPELSVAIAFVIFVVLVVWKGTSRITSGLDKRAQNIRRQLDEAQNLREEAQAALADFQRQQRDALTEAEQIVSNAKQEAERLKVEAGKALAVTLKRREEQAMTRIAQAEAKALQEVREQAVDLVISVTSKLISENMNSDVENAVLKNSIDELAGKLQ